MYRNILVAVDNNEHAERIVENAIETALAYNCKLTVCHIKKNTIIYNPVDPTGMLATPQIFTQDYSNAMEEELERIQKRAYEAGIKEVEIVQTYSSSPGLAIAEVIAPGYECDLIICGASNKSTLDRFLLGSVTMEIVKHAKCDVKLIRHLKNSQKK